MNIFIAGGTGAIGRALVPVLVEAGHDVTVLARSRTSRNRAKAMGAQGVIANVFDKGELQAAIIESKPDVVVHQLTAIDVAANPKRLDAAFALTNRFRTEVLDHMLEAARIAGARRFIAQSFCGWPFAREGGPVKTEADPLDPNPPRGFRRTLASIRYLENTLRQVRDLQALVLRYGVFYGPGTALSEDGALVEQVRQRKLPIVGSGRGTWSFIHVEDAARATAAAITRGAPGIYNVVDDDPAPVSSWLPELANAVGARPPRRVPAWLARLAIGKAGVVMMTRIRGGSNRKAGKELGWRPRFSSWREGFRKGLG